MATKVTDLPSRAGAFDGTETIACESGDGVAYHYTKFDEDWERYGMVRAVDFLDGIRTDGEAIQAAIDYIYENARDPDTNNTSGGTVLITQKPGTTEQWKIEDKTVVIYGSGITVKGSGVGGAIVDGVNVPAFKFGQDHNPAHGGSGELDNNISAIFCHLVDISVRGLVGLTSGDPAVMMQVGRNNTVQRCQITTYGSPNAGCIGHVENPDNVTGMYDVSIRDCNLAVHVSSTERTSSIVHSLHWCPPL